MRPITQQLLHLIKDLQRKGVRREEEQLFVIEGPHLIEECLRHHGEIRFIAGTLTALEKHASLVNAAGSEIFTLTERQIGQASDTEKPQGILAVVRMPEPRQVLDSRIVLVLDGIQDPGNVGTLIRTAAWFGLNSIVLGRGCSDLYNPKVIRATQGALFAVRVMRNQVLGELMRNMRGQGFRIVATALAESAENIYSFEWPEKCMVVLGSEARGVSLAVLEAATDLVIIPRFGTGESLNVAVSGGVLLSELARTHDGFMDKL